MNKLFVVPLANDSDIEILFLGPREQGPVGYTVQDQILEKAADTFEAALEMARHIGQCANERLSSLATNGVEVKIGFNLDFKGKFVVAETSAAASIEVKFVINKIKTEST